MKPSLRITDPDFRYVNSAKTDIRKLFARVRREQKAEAEERAAQHKVLALPAPKNKGTR